MTLLVMVIIGVIAALLGFWVGRVSGDQQQIKSQYEERLLKAEQELSAYRQQVNEHFQGTAQLVEQMNENYRAVYMHLAKGAQQLTQSEVMPAYGGAVIEAETDKERLMTEHRQGDAVVDQEDVAAKVPPQATDEEIKDQAESARKAGL